MEFALEAIESPKGRHASAMENAEHALEHLCSVERRLDFPNEKGSIKAGSSNCLKKNSSAGAWKWKWEHKLEPENYFLLPENYYEAGFKRLISKYKYQPDYPRNSGDRSCLHRISRCAFVLPF